MGIFQQFPYTNFHEMNLDQIIKIMREMQDEWATTKTEWNSYKEFIDNYFANLDLDDEVLNALRAMAADGSLSTVADPIIAAEVTEWLNENVTPTTPVVDASLTISEAAADAKITGDYFSYIMTANNVNIMRSQYLRTGKAYLYDNGSEVTNANYNAYYMIPCEPNTEYYLPVTNQTHICYYNAKQEYISGYLTTLSPYVTSCVIKTPATARYITISINTNYSANSGIVEKPYVTDDSLPIIAADVNNIYMSDIKNLPENFVKVSGANLFNKARLTHGYYPASNDGSLQTNAQTSIGVIECEPSTVYAFGGFRGCHCVWFNTAGQYISGFVTASPAANEAHTSPSTAKYLAFMIWDSDISLNNTYIVKGSSGKYSEYGTGDVYELALPRILTVGSNQAFTSIQDAINSSQDGDIILVMPGTYNEHLSLLTSNMITIMGVNRDECIISYSGQDYNTPPINISRGVLKNLTFIATNTGAPTDHTAYALHCDSDYAIGTVAAPASLYVENCKFITYMTDRAPVGIGLRKYFTAEFINCEMYSESNSALYCHDWEAPAGTTDLNNQRLVLKNCTLYNNANNAFTIMLQSQELNNANAYALFQFNVVKNLANSSAQIGMHLYRENQLPKNKYLGSSDWTLLFPSYGNNAASMNA